MSAPIATTTFSVPAPGTCPQTYADSVAGLNALVSTIISGDYPNIISGSSTPAVDDQDKIWDRTDAQGRHIGLYAYYAGHWSKIYTHSIGETAIFTDDPTGLFDGTGLGIIDTDWYGWAMCNGQNGTKDFTNLFPIGGTFSGGVWTTTVAGVAAETGGAATVTLDSAHTWQAATNELAVGRWTGDNPSSSSVNGKFYGITEAANSTVLIAGDAGNQSPDAITTVPPFRACSLIRFVGYP